MINQNDAIKKNPETSEVNRPEDEIKKVGTSDNGSQTISLPKGGGAISGIGEKFQANAVTGTANFNFPIALTEGRNGFSPQLNLAYDSGSGNGIFGLGWSLDIPSIRRKTQKGLPLYQDNNESDIYLLSGSEDLIPALKEDNNDWISIRRVDGDFSIKQYRPRVEGLFAKIELFKNTTTGATHWEVTTKDNITSVYGIDEASQLYDAQDNSKVFEWLLSYTYDEKGNIVHYQYKQENADGLDNKLYEKNRLKFNTAFNKKYIKQIKYTPDIPFDPDNSTYFEDVKWHFQLVFDYGDHDESNPTIQETNTWSARQDIFSNYRAGFELRTYRLCKRVLCFHYFENELGTSPTLVKSTTFTYDENPLATRMLDAQHLCHDGGATEAYPPVSFTYSEAKIDKNIHEFSSESKLPEGIADQEYNWIDLKGEGLPGILLENQSGWFYQNNLGDENYYDDNTTLNNDPPVGVLGTMKQISLKPKGSNLSNGFQQITDVNGDGTPDLLINGPQLKGFYAQNAKGEWQSFQAFEENPNINWQDPNLRLIDLNGDGFADIMVTEENCFVCYQSLAEKGHEEAYKTIKGYESDDPNIVFSDGEQSFYLADMSGDGLTDILRVRNGNICYWPNMGYGKFGKKITMDNTPLFDNEEIFNQSRIKLGDVDGSGTTDIVYISADNISYYPNLSGNSFADPVVISQRIPTHDLVNIQLTDLLGKGVLYLVWSSPVQADMPPVLKFIDLMGSVKPYLLIEVNNNMGSLTRMKYAPSTKFYLRDQRNNKPWITKLPFPVQVLERVEIYDEINNNRFVTKYAYHHGFYDGREREFRGFGMVEQWDSETFTDFTNEGLFPPGYNASEEILHAPPILTKTWFHTGFYQKGKAILGQYENEYYPLDSDALWLDHQIDGLIPGSLSSAVNWNLIDENTSAETIREAARALKGSPLRQEVYALDGSADEKHPYVVTENNYTLKLVQPRAASNRRDRDYASFLVTPAETVSHQYERNPADPRISHQMVLETDAFGNVLKSAAIGYGRRATASQAYAEQDNGLITVSENSFINEAENVNFYRLGVPSESKSYQLYLQNNLQAPIVEADRFRPSDILDSFNLATAISFEAMPDGSLQKRLLSHGRSYYYDENLNESTPLPLGEVASHGLPFKTYQLALTAGLVTQTLNDNATRVDSALLNEGGYVDLLSDGNSWIASGKVIYNPAAFYLPIAQDDPFDNRSTITYDAFSLLILETADALQNTTTVEYDYRLLQPLLVTDPNGNRTAFEYDVRGMVTTNAIMGKENDGDGDTLADPTTTFAYDLFRWMNEQKPNYAHTKQRERYAYASTEYREHYVYSDGLGQVIMTKMLAANGDAIERDANGDIVRTGSGDPKLTFTSPRWIGSGRTIFDNKGNPVKQYEPYYSSTEEFESLTELVEYGVTPVMYYDPLGRLIKTDYPDDTLSRVEFDPWQQKNYDQNDTVLESLWYVSRNSPDPVGSAPTDPEERAAWLAAKHADTPQQVIFDALGRPFITIDDNGNDGLYTMTTQLDIKGNALEITDAKGRQAFTYTYGLADQVLKTTHLDKGTSYGLANVLGNALSAWDARGHVFKNLYDELQRPTQVWLGDSNITDPDLGSVANPKLIAFNVYGEQQTNPESQNLRGKVYLTFDSSGLLKHNSYYFDGQLYEVDRRMAADYKSITDWQAITSGADPDAILTNADGLLETEIFQQQFVYNVQGQVNRYQMPKGGNTNQVYDNQGRLYRVFHRTEDSSSNNSYGEQIYFNARGQRERIRYGNDTQSWLTYDDKTFRLKRLLTTKNSDGAVLQDLNYTYDPVGNITEMTDNAQQTIFFNNTQVNPTRKYRYDALYRLTAAEGREFANNNTAPGPTDAAASVLPDNNSAALRIYDQQYTYDEMGNILQQAHNASGGSWNRYYHYAANNFLLSTSTDGTQPTIDQYTYDTHGNMLQMPHLANISWDHNDNMQEADLGGGGTAYYVYNVAGERIRKVIENGAVKEDRLYIGGRWELYRKSTGGSIDTERESVHIFDDQGARIALIDKTTIENGSTLGTPTVLNRFHLSNHLGSSNLELDYSAALISYEEYYPFGSTSYSSGRNAAETSLKRYCYVGKERDDETGLYYYGARYYASWLCRFVSVDPLKDNYPHLNSYNYAGNKPIGDIDVDGMQGTGEENRNGGQTHVTEKGDTYSGLAKEYGTTVESLRALNGYEDTKIPIGVNLKISNLSDQENFTPIQLKLNFEVPAVNDATTFKLNYAEIGKSNNSNSTQDKVNYLSTASGLLGGLSSSSKALSSNLSLPSQESPIRLKSFKGIDVAPENIYLGKRGSGRLRIKPNSNLRIPNPVKTDLNSFGNSTAKFSTIIDGVIIAKEGYEAITELDNSGSWNNTETRDFLTSIGSFATGYYYPVTGLIALLTDMTLSSPSFREKMRNENKKYIMENRNRFRPDTPELERARELFLKFGGKPSELYIDNTTTISPR